jgi:hypothetical protein
MNCDIFFKFKVLSFILVLCSGSSLEVASTAAQSTSNNEIKFDNVQDYLKLMNTKLDIINSAILNGNICSELKLIFNQKFEIIEEKLAEVYHKNDELINQNNMLLLKATQKNNLNIDEDISLDSDDFRNRFSSNDKSENENSRKQNETDVNSDESIKITKRRSRYENSHVYFINEILRMVNDRFEREKNEKNSSSSTEFLKTIDENLNTNERETSSSSSSILHMNNNQNTTKNNNNSSGRKSNIVFPNTKNRLAMMNASSNFISTLKRETYVMMKKFNLS